MRFLMLFLRLVLCAVCLFALCPSVPQADGSDTPDSLPILAQERIQEQDSCLSAYCGAVSAGCAAGAAVAWLHGGDLSAVAHTLVNSLAILSGMVCDGAKPSCAAKIACAVDSGILGWQMYRNGKQFYGGDGIVTKGVENTIANVSRMGREGMRETDREIIHIMLENN